jgi:MerR family copper efflux transcriptional regulator
MLTIGRVAKRTGLSTSAIRYYERQGVLMPSRQRNGYRVYDEHAVKELNFLRQSQQLGITIREIKQLLELTRKGRRPCNAVRELVGHHLTEIELKIRQLQTLRGQLAYLLSRREESRRSDLCPLVLETLEAFPSHD